MRIRYLVLLTAPLALAACLPFQIGSIPVPTAPVVVADKTTYDEAGIMGARTLYETWLTLVEIGTDGGAIHGATATKVLAIDDRVHAAYAACVSAYKASNAASYTQAKHDLEQAIADGTAAIKGN